LASGLTLKGNGLDNMLRGNSDNNVLNGGVGNDAMVGGACYETFLFNLDGGFDRVWISPPATAVVT
jgi:Ca2+-binding RTX toxin-like protein